MHIQRIKGLNHNHILWSLTLTRVRAQSLNIYVNCVIIKQIPYYFAEYFALTPYDIA